MDSMNQNFMYQQPTQNLNPPYTQGGYPYGYPSFASQPNIGYSPFPNPMPFNPVTQMEVTYKDGRSETVPIPQGFVPGGTTTAQGGFNPMTGQVTPAVGTFGYNSNPYTNPQLIGNPGYQPNAGYGVYEPPNYPRQPQPFGYHGQPMPQYGINNPYYQYQFAQNQYNSYIQELMYEENPSAFDPKEILEQVVLTDEEREKIYRGRNYIGQDYYGRPMYSNPWQASQDRQKALEEERKRVQTHFTTLSKIAHAYSGEEIDVEATMKRFDPIPPSQNQPKIFNWYTATEDEKNEYQKEMRVAATDDIIARIAQAENLEAQTIGTKQALYDQIKASHDRLIGVEPGQHYDLKTFMENGYKIGINIAMQKAKSINRNGQNKYSTSSYRNGMAQATNSQIPITSKDDEYVSIEQMLKGVYERNRSDSIRLSQQRSENGSYTSPEAYSQVPEFNTEKEAHQYFLQAIQEKKIQDDIRKSVI